MARFSRPRGVPRRDTSTERKSPVDQRALPHQGEPSLAGQTRFSSLVAATGHGGLISKMQGTAVRTAVPPGHIEPSGSKLCALIASSYVLSSLPRIAVGRAGMPYSSPTPSPPSTCTYALPRCHLTVPSGCGFALSIGPRFAVHLRMMPARGRTPGVPIADGGWVQDNYASSEEQLPR
jgi:hypothetical protein